MINLGFCDFFKKNLTEVKKYYITVMLLVNGHFTAKIFSTIGYIVF